MTNEEVIRETARRTGYPYEQIRIMMVDFYHQVLINLQNPENNFNRGIKVRNCCKFELNPNKVLHSLSNSRKKEHDTRFSRNLETLNQQLKDNEIYTEGQKDFEQALERTYPQRGQIKSSHEAENS